MTYAPDDLRTIRNWLLAALDMHPGNVGADLEPDEVGIAGDPAHASTGGYHEGNSDLSRVGRLSSDYSKRQSTRDRPGTDAASALDIGEFASHGFTLPTFSLALVAACQRGDPRTRDVREVIYSPDGKTVRRWDRLGQSTTGDVSHLFHTHLSFFRDSEGRRANPDNILGLFQALIEGDDVALNTLEAAQVSNTEHYLQALVGMTDAASGISDTVNTNLARPNELGRVLRRLDAATTGLLASSAAEQARDAAAKAAIDALAAALAAGGGSVDSAAIIARMNAIASDESAAVAALRAQIAALQARLAAAEQAAAATLSAP